ncbi:hypothetical protein OQH60_03695 [Campylobacter sp. MIT 21-1685]|uniref:hypothetical protein n=1 Tax=unclassified Campylobacter TaxID=2593542 RepID=UPI00224B6E23|nr:MULTISPECIES: hypothetical protein [unclassified Campylobacter]MCX2682965.1 hypothetical protein [Campylobacter sp. MIT 21-1684]MCX2751247.1 hypothetical protein [Campylobacter sp. MIT 21-1682]MCX2807446.1 hypothetical protein [Campylobacter sp. MIT 21-1685]
MNLSFQTFNPLSNHIRNQTNSFSTYNLENKTNFQQNLEKELQVKNSEIQKEQEIMQETKANNTLENIKEDLESLLPAKDLAKENFPKIANALNSLSNADTNEKVEWHSLSKEQQKQLLKFLSDELFSHQDYMKDKNIDFFEVKIHYDGKYVSASSEFIDSKGEKINISKLFMEFLITNEEDKRLANSMTTRRYSGFFNQDAQRSLDELAKDYVRGDTDNYFGFLKKKIDGQDSSSSFFDTFYKHLEILELIAKREFESEKLEESQNVRNFTQTISQEQNISNMFTHSINLYYEQYAANIQNLFEMFLLETSSGIQKNDSMHNSTHHIKSNTISTKYQQDEMLQRVLKSV